MFITRIIDQSVATQTDTLGLKAMFKDIHPNVAVVFICTRNNWRKDDYWIDRKDGTIYYNIRLPYEEVSGLEDAAPLMLEFLNNRLEEIPPGSKPMRKSSSRGKKTLETDVVASA